MKLLEIRKTSIEDYLFLKKWFEDQKNNTYFSSQLRNITDYKKIFLQLALSKKTNNYYTIVEDTKPIGFIAIFNIDFIDNLGELWYVLGDKNYANKGITSKAVNSILEIAKKEFKLHTIHAWVVEDNIVSSKVLTKNGFEYIGSQKEAYYNNGIYKTRLLYNKIL